MCRIHSGTRLEVSGKFQTINISTNEQLNLHEKEAFQEIKNLQRPLEGRQNKYNSFLSFSRRLLLCD